MSQYYGDIQLGDTIQWLFTTVNTTPVPTVLTGTPTATAYTDGGVTQSATGVTITADFDGVVGLNQISVVATSGNGFAAGENIEIVLDAGTVGGNTVVGYAVGSFSIENRSNLRPTTVGNNEVDVTATGAVGIDWGNIENQGTTVDLSATTTFIVDTATAVTTVNGLAANVITAAAIAAAALNGKGDWNIGKTGYSLTQAFPTNFADLSITLTTGLVTLAAVTHTGAVIPTVTTLTGHTPQTADHTAGIADIPTVAEFNARTILSASYFDPATDTVVTVTNLTNLPSIPANWLTAAGINAAAFTAAKFAAGAIDANALATDAVNEISRAIGIQKNTAFSDFGFHMVLTSDHVTPATGLTVTGERMLDGAAFVGVSGTITEVSDGYYQFDALAADTNGDTVVWKFSSATADDSGISFKTVA